MKIKSIKTIKKEHEVPVYDVIENGPYHNFVICTPEHFVIAHNCGLLDEVDFVKGASARMEQSKVMKMYNGVKRRMESRFMRNGELPGVLFLVSSKKSEHDFLEQYAKTQRDNENVLIIDEPLWKVKPASNYSGKVFHVAVGNKYVKSKIIRDTEDLDSYEKQGFRVIDVPVEHRQPFELDIDSALMDIAGISTTSKTKFISFDRLKQNYSKRSNPFQIEVLTIGLDDNLEIKDFFVPDMISQGTRAKPGFIHIDTSLNGDKTGISYVVIEGTKKVDQYDKNPETGEAFIKKNVIDLIYKQVFTIGIAAPSDSEISFEKTRQFIYYLRQIGFNIKEISLDGFQSRDTMQLLKNAGYNTKLVSLDKTPTGYQVFKTAINEERLDLLALNESLVEKEIIELEADSISRKVDHPIDGCFTGDTKIKLLNEPPMSISALIESLEFGERHWTYCVNPKKLSLEIDYIRKVFHSKDVKELLKITFKNGKSVTCTPEHLFMTHGGRYCEAQNLGVGERLMGLPGEDVSIQNILRLKLQKPVPVYDIEMGETCNFMLDAGCIVHNSKDLSDSLCGAVYLASMYKLADSMRHASEDAKTMVQSLMTDTLSTEDDLLADIIGSDYTLDSKTQNMIKRNNDLYEDNDNTGFEIVF